MTPKLFSILVSTTSNVSALKGFVATLVDTCSEYVTIHIWARAEKLVIVGGLRCVLRVDLGEFSTPKNNTSLQFSQEIQEIFANISLLHCEEGRGRISAVNHVTLEDLKAVFRRAKQSCKQDTTAMACRVLWNWRVLLANLILISLGCNHVEAQMNVYIAKRDANSCLKLNFNMDLYMIKDNEPVSLLKDPKAFRDFLAPLSAKIDVVKLSWFSSPKKSRYHIRMRSSDTEIMPHPEPSIAVEGMVSHSATEFDVSFGCTGRKEGIVEVSLELNYTSVVSGAIRASTQRTFTLLIRRWCEKTIPDPTTKASTSGAFHWSRAAIVGLCAGITLVICLSIGMVLLIKYLLRQRRLKMEFEDDLDLTEKREYSKRKIRSLPLPRLYSPKTSPPVIYSPKRQRFPVAGQRPRSETNRSDTSRVGLICQDDSDDDDRGTVQQVCECQTREEQLSVWPTPTTKPIPESTPQTTEILAQMMKTWSSQLTGYLISKEQLEIKECITEEALYEIYRGVLIMDSQANCTQEVAVRILKDNLGNDLEAVTCFVQGAIAMKHLSHPNVLPLIGVILQPSSPPCVITTYQKDQRLTDLLLQSRGSPTKPQALTSEILLNIAIQAAKGIEYLANRRAVNLLTPNCMVSEGYDVRIDTQMNQHHSSTADDRHGVNTMVPECLGQTAGNEKNNVFSFGAILWEIITLGKELPPGPSLPKPVNCPDELYDILIKCRHEDPAARPALSWTIDWLSEYQKRLFPGTLTFQTLQGSLPINC